MSTFVLQSWAPSLLSCRHTAMFAAVCLASHLLTVWFMPLALNTLARVKISKNAGGMNKVTYIL